MDNNNDYINYLQNILNQQNSGINLQDYKNQPFVYSTINNYGQQIANISRLQSVQNFALQNTINNFLNSTTIKRQQINNSISQRNIQGGLGNLILHQQDLAQASQTGNIINQSEQQSAQIQNQYSSLLVGLHQLLSTVKPNS